MTKNKKGEVKEGRIYIDTGSIDIRPSINNKSFDWIKLGLFVIALGSLIVNMYQAISKCD